MRKFKFNYFWNSYIDLMYSPLTNFLKTAAILAVMLLAAPVAGQQHAGGGIVLSDELNQQLDFMLGKGQLLMAMDRPSEEELAERLEWLADVRKKRDAGTLTVEEVMAIKEVFDKIFVGAITYWECNIGMDKEACAAIKNDELKTYKKGLKDPVVEKNPILEYILTKAKALNRTDGVLGIAHCKKCTENDKLKEIKTGTPETFDNGEVKGTSEVFDAPGYRCVSILYEQLTEGLKIVLTQPFSEDQTITNSTLDVLFAGAKTLSCNGFLGDLDKYLECKNEFSLSEAYINALYNQATACLKAENTADYEVVAETEVSPEELEKLKKLVSDFSLNQKIAAKVTIVDLEDFESTVQRAVVDKDVHLILGKNGDKYEYKFLFRSGLFTYPTTKTLLSGETIKLEYEQSKVEFIRDQHIDLSIANAQAIGALTKRPEPTLNIFERGMWVVKVTKETLAKVKVPEPMWNPIVEPKTYPFQLEALTAGLGDGAVDELKSIPDLILLALSLFDEEERTALISALQKMDFETVKKMFKDKGAKYAQGGVVALHEGGYDGVQIASMFWGGAFIKGAKKGSETAEAITDILKKLPNSVTDKLSDLSDVARRTLLEDLGKSDELLEAFSKNSDLLDSWKLLDEAGVDETFRRNLEALSDPDAALEAVQMSQKAKPTWPEIQALFKRGNDFNKKGYAKYGFENSEIVLQGLNGKAGKRLDAYIPREKIISRKATDIDNITEQTWRNYCSELVSKYKVGTPLNSTKMPGEPPLSGKYYLEIPSSNQIAQKLESFKSIAKEYGADNGGIEIIFLVE